MTSRIWSTMMFATLCVILRSRLLIIYIGLAIRAVLVLGDRAGCGEGGAAEEGKKGMNESYVTDG